MQAEPRPASATHSVDSTKSTAGRLSPGLRWALAAATTVTLAFAGLSAWAVHSEPTMRAEDSSYQSRSKALAVRRSLAVSKRVERFSDSGATRSDEYLDRAQVLDRSL